MRSTQDLYPRAAVAIPGASGGPRDPAPPAKAVFYGSMARFDVDLDGFAPRMLPGAFARARELHATNASRNVGRIIGLLQPFARAVFIPHTLTDWERFFVDPSARGMPETIAAKVRLCGVDFANCGGDGFPLATMEAWFAVPVAPSFTPKRFRTWEEESGVYLSDAVSFGWQLPPLKRWGRPLCFPWLNHCGSCCTLIDQSKTGSTERA